MAADPKSAELLKPFLKGENIKRWRVEPEGLWLINTPKGKVDIEAYPAIREWLLPFKDRLEARATQQEWWELQQAQLAYQDAFQNAKIAYQDICNSNPFTLDVGGNLLANTCYFVPTADQSLLGYLNSKLAWFFWLGITNIARGGYLRLRTDFVEKTPVPRMTEKLQDLMAKESASATRAANLRHQLEIEIHHRLLSDLAAPGASLSRKLREFHELDFAAFRAEVKRALKVEIPVKERAQWEELHAEASGRVKELTTEIAAAEREIDRLVYEAFELTGDEIALLEASLEGQV